MADKPGDIVQVGAGVYVGRVYVRRGGSVERPIVIRGHDGTGCPTQKIEDDFNSRGERPDPAAEAEGFSVEASNVVVECFRLSGTSGKRDIAAGVYIAPESENIEIRDNRITGEKSPGVPWAGVSFKGGVPVEKMARNIRITRNYIHLAGYGLLLLCKQCIVEENEIERMFAVDGVGDNDYMRIFGEDILISRNYLHGNRSGDCVGCHIDCFQTYNLGQVDNVARRVAIDRNICFEAHQGIIARDVSTKGEGETLSHFQWHVTNNVFGYGPSGGPMPWCALFDHIGDVVFEHNLCIGTGAVGYLNGSRAIHRFNIHHNAGWKPYSADGGGNWKPGTVKGAGNLLHQVTRQFIPSQWPDDIVNVQAVFRDEPKRVFYPTGDSAVVDRAIGSDRQYDLLGNERPKGGTSDIGPYEYEVTEPNTEGKPVAGQPAIVRGRSVTTDVKRMRFKY